MAAGIALLGLIIFVLIWLLLSLPQRPKVPRNYGMVFQFYDLGYADQKAGNSETDWSEILEAKEENERIKFEREVKAYKLGYDEARQGKPKRTERMARASAEYDQLLKELSEYLE